MESISYKTRQKDIILIAIKKQKQVFTVKEIHQQLKDQVGLTTIYRLIDKLVEDGRLRKNVGTNNDAYYQYLEDCKHDNHFYLKCSSCGKIIHVDCDCINNLYSHIFKNHKFKLNKKNIIIDGICERCMEV